MTPERRVALYANRIAAIVLLLLVVLAFSTVWLNAYNDRLSCRRSQITRAGLALFFAGAAHRSIERELVDRGLTLKLDREAAASSLSAYRRENALACGGLFPSATQ